MIAGMTLYLFICIFIYSLIHSFILFKMYNFLHHSNLWK